MQIAGIRNLNTNTNMRTRTSFKGVFEVFKKDSKEIDKNHSTVATTDFFDSFKKKGENISEDYKKEREKAEKRFFFRKRELRRIDDEYRGRMKSYYEDQEIFIREKEKHLKDIQALLDNAQKYNMALEELTKLKSDFQATQKAVEIAKKQQAANKDKGFSRLAGYEEEKSTLQKVLINKIIEEQAGNPQKLPNAILFFGPTGVGKTAFAKALAQEIKEGNEPVIIDMSNEPDEIMEEIEVMSRRSRNHYKRTGERTVILLDEIEVIATDDSEVLDELKQKLTKAFEDDKCIYMMTTNYPTLISKDILTPDRTSYIINLDPPNEENAEAVVKYYFSRLSDEEKDIDYNRIAKEIVKCKNGAYSNSGIEELYKQSVSRKINTTSGIIKLLNKMRPNITQGELESYLNDKRIFLGED